MGKKFNLYKVSDFVFHSNTLLKNSAFSHGSEPQRNTFQNMVKKLLYLWLLIALTIASPRQRKGQARAVSLGNGRWAPIAGSREEQTDSDHDVDHDFSDAESSESRRVQIYARPPPSKLEVHDAHPDLPFKPSKLLVHREKETYVDNVPYKFGYEFRDDGSNHHGGGSQQWRHEEGGQNGSKRGSYGYRDALGIYRHVDYIADEHGFRVTIRTNEPGTANQNSAGVDIQLDPTTSSGFHGRRTPLIVTRKPSKYPILPVYRSTRIRKISTLRRTDLNLNLPDLRMNLEVPQETAWYPMHVSPRTGFRDTIFKRWL